MQTPGKTNSLRYPPITCTSCRGDGVVVQWSGANYDSDVGGYYPGEVLETCRDCEGSGEALCTECGAGAVHEDPSVEHTYFCHDCRTPGVQALLDMVAEHSELQPQLWTLAKRRR